jgi:hypothetical protein
VKERRQNTIIALERIHKYYKWETWKGHTKGISEFYFEILQKLQNEGWSKNSRRSAWLDCSIFQLLKTQVKAKSSTVEGNTGMFESQNGLL